MAYIGNSVVGVEHPSTSALNATTGTFTGALTQDGGAVFNEGSADVDFRVESNGNANMLTVNAGDNRVGIGCDPERDLHVKGASGDPVHFKLEGDASDYARIMFDDATDDNIGEIRYDFGSDFMQFTVNAGEAFRVDNSKNLLIAKTASGIATAGIELRANKDVLITNDGGSCLYLNRLTDDGPLVEFNAAGTTRGNIGVASSENFYISGQDNNQVGLMFNGDGERIVPCNAAGTARNSVIDLGENAARFKDAYTHGTVFSESFAGVADTDTLITMSGSNVMQFFTASSERARFDANGKFLISTTSLINNDGAMLQSNGGTNLAFGFNVNSDQTLGRFYRSGSIVGSISVDTSNTTYATSSDRRLKSNIQDAKSASDKIDAIQVRQFDWNVDNKHQDYGLIAQELEPIESLAVTGDADGEEMMGVDYGKLVPMLIKEIQELRSRVAALEE